MTTKDYIYLGLLAFAAVVFYLNGYHAGLNRSRRLFERVFNDCPEMPDEGSGLPQPEGSESRLTLIEPEPRRRHHKIVAAASIRAVFGKN
ncbi:MAG TPA: hypothetical protein VNO52_00205 [Methylomirabilota bacterium]|nr:hypothetical protein [Methylomirabilota bacterium]